MEKREPLNQNRNCRYPSRLGELVIKRPFVVAVSVSVASIVALSGCGSTSGSSASRSATDRVIAVKGMSSAETTSETSDTRQATGSPESPQTAGASRFVLGSPEPGLSFAAPALLETGTPSASDTTGIGPISETRAGSGKAITAESATDAARLFGDAIVAGRVDDAFELLPDLEQKRVGSANKFAEVLSRDAVWLSSAIERAQNEEVEGEVVALRVTQTPMIDEIHGVVAPSSVVQLPASKESSGWKVSWERRRITQQFAAPQSRLEADVVSWAAARQKQCARTEKSSTGSVGNGDSGNVKIVSGNSPKATPEGEYSGGLLGAVWLADELCTVPGAVTVSAVGDIYSLDDPQPLLDAYGSGSYQWTRIVTLAAPHAMQVMAAPLDQRWVIVGVAPVNSFN